MTFIICELGINSNGSLDICKKMIDAAKWAGADCVKLQKRTPELCVPENMKSTMRDTPWGRMSYMDYKYKLEFKDDDYNEIDRYCKQIRIPWMASAWDIPSLEFLDKYDLPYNKIASAMATYEAFIYAVGNRRKPTFASTAMCTYDDISKMMNILEHHSGCKTTLMHCVATYPADEKDLNLQMRKKLGYRYSCDVGYSGHETSVSPSVVAVALGAVAIERHITLDRSMWGTDQAASLEPHGFKTMVDQIRKMPEILGDGIKRILPAEQEVAKKLRYWI